MLSNHLDCYGGPVPKPLTPFEAQIKQLDTISGVNERAAENIVAVIGVDMGRFPNADHLVMWRECARAAMRIRESAGPPRIRKGTRSSGAHSRWQAKPPGAPRTRT
jgi:hypothetical protein